MSPAQLASEKPIQSVDPFITNCNPKMTVPAMYQRTCLTTFQCCSVGLAVNLATVLVARQYLALFE